MAIERVAYVAFEPFPNAKGSGTRIGQMLRALVGSGREVVLLTLPGRGAGELPPGVEHRALPVFRGNFLERALAFRHRVARELHALRPHAIHFRGIFEGQAAMAYAERHPGCTTIFEVNGLPSVELPYHYPAVGQSLLLLDRLRRCEQALLLEVDAAVTQSHTTLAYLRGRRLPAATPSFVIPNGAVVPPSRDPAPSGPPTVLYAGTLTPWQGVAELLMAARRCNRERELRFVLAGPIRRRWRGRLERVIRRLRVEDAVELTDALPREALAERVAAARICVAPLRRDRRNEAQGCSPIKLFEYLAAGRPTVVTDLPCTREIIGPERGVLLHAPRPKAIAEALLGLLDDPDRAEALGRAGRAWVEAHATWDRRRAALVDAYASLESAARG
ncbi:MAG: glycosyltransferase family 4 protein [Myxococcales bacterium]|nr:glycosyltransferase family 4 protein [Myxococcales bacterium]MCB9714191.1 glycosyltransferase family 4 protein [Myxococcales bacterium]